MSRYTYRQIASDGAARRGELTTAHGVVADRPPSCRSGRKAPSRRCTPTRCAKTGADVVLGNTYHLMLRPGAERVARLGGLHQLHATGRTPSLPIPAASR